MLPLFPHMTPHANSICPGSPAPQGGRFDVPIISGSGKWLRTNGFLPPSASIMPQLIRCEERKARGQIEPYIHTYYNTSIRCGSNFSRFKNVKNGLGRPVHIKVGLGVFGHRLKFAIRDVKGIGVALYVTESVHGSAA